MSNQYQYNPWPLGKVPKEFQRPELDQLKESGYQFDDARDVVDMFEKKVAAFAGSKYAVAVDCCSHALFLCLKYVDKKICDDILKTGKFNHLRNVILLPKRTYISVPMQVKHAGFKFEFEDIEWSGIYQLKPHNVYDGAVRWTKGMYVGNDALQTVSFQIKKRVPIGKGGMILTDSEEAYKWLKLASYDGRDLTLPYNDPVHIKMIGYHMYMTPEDAARGILLMDQVSEENEDTGNNSTYPDVEQMLKNIGYL
jgi:dTDP-4-amino-4,6-dideoxygalactose transaminase